MKERTTIKDIVNAKNTRKLVCLTAYTAPFTKILDKYVDILLVGDTVGMVLYGMDSTLPVNVDMMINHGKAVVKASKRAFVVVDMPFASYQASKRDAYNNAARIMAQTGCQAVKLEGGIEMVKTVEFLTARGIPVMGHVGLMPQKFNCYGGFKVQGKEKAQYDMILEEAKMIENAGAFALVIECVPEALAMAVTKELAIPVIGIGASAKCDGQVLVTEDMAGLFSDYTPKFVKKYVDMGAELEKAVKKFALDVKSGKFPEKNHLFS